MEWSFSRYARAGLWLGIALSGAGPTAAQPAPAPAASAASAPRQTIVVAAYPAVDEIVKAALPQWRLKHPNVEVRVLSRTFNDHHSAMAASLSTASNLPDVMIVEAGSLSRLAANNQLEDLSQPPFNAGSLQKLFVPYAFRQGMGQSTGVSAIPSDIGPGTLLYRVDLLTKAGVTPAELTQSWESFIAAGLKLKATTGAYLVGHAGSVGTNIMQSTAKPGEGRYFDASGKVQVQTERFVRAFELSRKIRQNGLDAKAGSWGAEWNVGVKSGTIATLMSGAWMAGHLSTWLAPNSKGLWRVTNMPENTWGSFGGTFYTIPKRAKGKAMAWEFVRYMTLNQSVQLQAFKSQNAFPALLEAHADPFFEQPIDYLGGQKARLLWRDASRQVHEPEPHPLDQKAREVLLVELNKVLDHNKDVQRALADAQETLERVARQSSKPL